MASSVNVKFRQLVFPLVIDPIGRSASDPGPGRPVGVLFEGQRLPGAKEGPMSICDLKWTCEEPVGLFYSKKYFLNIYIYRSIKELKQTFKRKTHVILLEVQISFQNICSKPMALIFFETVCFQDLDLRCGGAFETGSQGVGLGGRSTKVVPGRSGAVLDPWRPKGGFGRSKSKMVANFFSTSFQLNPENLWPKCVSHFDSFRSRGCSWFSLSLPLFRAHKRLYCRTIVGMFCRFDTYGTVIAVFFFIHGLFRGKMWRRMTLTEITSMREPKFTTKSVVICGVFSWQSGWFLMFDRSLAQRPWGRSQQSWDFLPGTSGRFIVRFMRLVKNGLHY